MTSRLTVRIPPELIESARAVQYANRRRLAARDLQAEIVETVKQRVDSARRAEPLPDDLVGGQLEFTKRKKRKIEVRRRRLRLGFLLIPSADYDNQLRLPVLTEYGGQQYAVTRDNIPFELVNNKLMAKSHPAAPDAIGPAEGNLFASLLSYTTPPTEEAFSVFTAEFFVSLDAGAQQNPIIQDMGNGTEKLTTYDSVFLFFFNQGSTFLPNINFSKRLNTEQGWNGGLRQSWGLVGSNQDTLLTQGGGEYHVAMTQSGNTFRIYFDGNLVRTYQSETAYNSPVGTSLESGFGAGSHRVETLRYQGGSTLISRFYYADTPRSGFRCYRFTPGQALYAGDSFTPPTSITDLA
jgi:hypothetical protein